MGLRSELNVEAADEVRLTLRRTRLQRGLTQREVCERAGIGQTHLSQLESGVWAPGWATLVSWVAALDAHLHVHVASGIITARVTDVDADVDGT